MVINSGTERCLLAVMSKLSDTVTDGDCTSESSHRSAVSRSPPIHVEDVDARTPDVDSGSSLSATATTTTTASASAPAPAPAPAPALSDGGGARFATGFFPGVVRASRWQAQNSEKNHRRSDSDDGLHAGTDLLNSRPSSALAPASPSWGKPLVRSQSSRSQSPMAGAGPKRAGGHSRQKSGHRRHRSYGSLSEISIDVSSLSNVAPLQLEPHEWGPVPRGFGPKNSKSGSLSPMPGTPPSTSPQSMSPTPCSPLQKEAGSGGAFPDTGPHAASTASPPS